MRFECVVTSVGYGDFLAWTLERASRVFDRTVVVTTPGDELTRHVCDAYYVECVPTNKFADPGPFCKGAGINVGLSKLTIDPETWWVHLDADIALPPQTGRVLRKLDLDPACIYGVDRHLIEGFGDWASLVGSGFRQCENNWKLQVGSRKLGARLIFNGSYTPVGYYQMWHPWYTQVERYPEGHTDAAREDVLHALKWRGGRRRLIPEFVGVHLESEPCPQGTNWQGRKTRPFGPL